MSGDRSTRNALAAVLLVAALFLAMNRVVSGAPLLDWWLPLVLAVLGGFFALAPRISWRSAPSAADDDAEPEEVSGETLLIAPGAHDYEVASFAAPPVAAVLPFGEAVDEAPVETVLPFGETVDEAPPTPQETPVSPETPAPLVEPEPEVEVPPMSPETPAPAAEPEAEPVPMSPETPTPEAPTEVLDEGPSQRLPVDRTVDTGEPAPELNFSARTEYANPDQAVASREPAPPPPPDDSDTATDHSEPEKLVVAEKTAAPQQPYEVEQVGEITPERAEQVMDESDNAHNHEAPVVSEAASERIAAQEINGEGAVGSGDDLEKIDGIGPKIAAALRAAGIDSFQKLANTSADTLRDAVNTAGVRMVGEVDTWAQQAGYAARSDWEGFENFNRERKSERKS